MKSFVRVKKIRGNEYLYEVTPYYDDVSGKVRQKTRYLGKRDESGAAITPSSRKQRSRVLSCGDYLPFLGVTRDLGLEAILRSVLSSRDTSTVLALAISLAARPGILTSLSEWYNRTTVSLAYPDADMRPGKILQLVQNLSDFHILERFSRSNAGPLPGTILAGLVFGIMREETSPFLREYCPPGAHQVVEYYMVVCDPGQAIVSQVQRLPGPARSRLNTCARNSSLTGDHVPVVFPMGCITAGHLGLLAEADFPFVLPVPPLRLFGWKDTEDILKAVLADSNYHTLQDEAVFIKASPVHIGPRIIPGFIVLNAPSERTARLRHHHEVFRIQEDLKNIRILPGVNPEGIIRDIAGDIAPFITWIPAESGGNARINREALMHSIVEAGMIMVLHQGRMTREECLTLLSARRRFNDIISERVQLLYQMMHRQPTDRMSEGLIFIAVLASALRWRLEILLPRLDARYSASLDTLMASLCSLTVTAGPGRRRKPSRAAQGQLSILEALDCLPDRVIPGCSPIPGFTDEEKEVVPEENTFGDEDAVE